MKKTLIVFEDGKKDLEAVANLIATSLNALDRSGQDVRVRAASLVTISELLAASRYILGADTVGAPSFAELGRVFEGINLAGRSVAFYSASDKALGYLKTLVKDTEVAKVPSDLNSAHAEPGAVTAWLKTLP